MLRQVQEKTLEGNGKRYWTFVDMEKAFDRVPREVVYWSLRKKGVLEKIVRLVRSMYVDAKTAVRYRYHMRIRNPSWRASRILSQPTALHNSNGCCIRAYWQGGSMGHAVCR